MDPSKYEKVSAPDYEIHRVGYEHRLFKHYTNRYDDFLVEYYLDEPEEYNPILFIKMADFMLENKYIQASDFDNNKLPQLFQKKCYPKTNEKYTKHSDTDTFIAALEEFDPKLLKAGCVAIKNDSRDPFYRHFRKVISEMQHCACLSEYPIEEYRFNITINGTTKTVGLYKYDGESG